MIYNLGELKPKIDKKTVWIADSADIIGDVVLEANVSVWFNVTIRGDNDTILIGQGSNVQDNTVIHTDFGIKVAIGINVTIGHKVKTIRYGQQGVRGAGKNPKTAKEKARRKSFKARHAKNIAKGKMSAAYWANRSKW